MMKRWESCPPLAEMVASYLGVKTKSSTGSGDKEGGTLEELAQFFPVAP